jgi:Caspase domain
VWQQDEMDGSREVLIVATNRYEDAELRRLRSPVQDAEALAKLLGDPAVGGFAVRTVVDQPAHVVNRAIQRFFDNRRPNDLLLLYLSCHAITGSDGTTYFAATNTEKRRLEETATSASVLNKSIDRSHARETIVILDCCRSRVDGPSSGDPPPGVMLDLVARGHSMLSGSSSIEYTWTGDQLSGEGKPSQFTAAIIEGLRTKGADIDGDGLISVRDLHQYLSQRGADAEYLRTAPVDEIDADAVFICEAASKPGMGAHRRRDRARGGTSLVNGLGTPRRPANLSRAALVLIGICVVLLAGGVVATALVRSSRTLSGVGGAGRPAPAILTRVVTMPADQPWTDTGVDLEPAERISIKATGSVQYVPGGSFVGPEGDSRRDSNQVNVLPATPHAALIGKVGAGGKPFSVGRSLSTTVGETGRLFLGLNDAQVDNNSGMLTVSIEVRAG